MKEETIDFASAKVSKLFRKLFFPTLLGMLGMSAMTAIDGIFIGHSVGSDGIAAVNIIVPMLMLLTGVGLMIGTGCSVVASVYLSRGQRRVACYNVTQALLLVTLIIALLTIWMLAFPDEAARWLGSSDDLLPKVKEYMVWYVPSWIFMGWTAISLFVIRLDGAPNYAMACSLVAALLNVVLDWLFMFPLGWGLMGGALATSISTAVGGIMAVTYLFGFARRLRPARIKLNAKSLRYTLRNVGNQCRIGSSALLAEATLAVLMFMGNQIFMHYLGDDGVGAFGIACYYTPFIFMVGNAIAQSAQPILSYNFGLGDRGRMRETERTAIVTALLCGFVVALVFVLLPEGLVGLFVSLENRAAQIAVTGLPLFAAGFLPFIFNITSVGYFQSVERVRPATSFALLRGFVLLVPSFLLLPRWLGDRGIWLAMPAAEMLTALCVVAFYRWQHRRPARRA